MHYTQLLALAVATAATVAALPLQQYSESSTPLGERFLYLDYESKNSINPASDPPPFGYDQYQGSLAKRFYYTHYVDDDDINSEDYGPGLAKRFYYTHYIDDDDIESVEEEYYGPGLAKRFYYTRYVKDDAIGSASDPPPFGYDQYQDSLAKRFYYTHYIDDDEINSVDEENYGPGLSKRFYYTRYIKDDSVESASQDPPPFGYDQYQALNPKKGANIVSHGQQPCDEHIPMSVQYADTEAEGKPAHAQSAPKHHEFKPHIAKAAPHRGNGHHGKSGWDSVKDMLHPN
jgi:hypothetical protein